MELEQFVATLKPFTKFYIFGSLLLSLIISLQIISPWYFVMIIPNQLWNPLKHICSLLLIKQLNFNLIISLIFFFFVSNDLESSYYPSQYGSFVYLLIFSYLGNLVIQKANSSSFFHAKLSRHVSVFLIDFDVHFLQEESQRSSAIIFYSQSQSGLLHMDQFCVDVV